MFCPNCRTEYRQGITVCADCGAKLINELPPETDGRELVTVLEAGDLAVVALAKSMLEEAGIQFVAKGELPMEQLAVGPVEIQVDKDNETEARELLTDLAEGASPINQAGEEEEEEDEDDETEGIDKIFTDDEEDEDEEEEEDTPFR